MCSYKYKINSLGTKLNLLEEVSVRCSAPTFTFRFYLTENKLFADKAIPGGYPYFGEYKGKKIVVNLNSSHIVCVYCE